MLEWIATPTLAENIRITPGLPGPLDPSSDGGVLAFVQNAYLFALAAAGLLAVASIAYGAILYTLSRGNPTALADAWDRIVQAFVGVLLLVGAGTILSIVNPGLTGLELPALQRPSNQRYEAAKLQLATEEIRDAEIAQFRYAATEVGASRGGTGKCAVIPVASNPCSQEKIATTCFGRYGANVVRQASMVCNGESAGNPVNDNKWYKCGTGERAVIGLWQINLKAHCPKAFKKVKGAGPAECIVIDKALYQQCVAWARDPAQAAQFACKLYASRKGSNKWADWEITHCKPKRFACCGKL